MNSGLNSAVIIATDCYPKGAGFDSRLMHGFSLLKKWFFEHWSDKSTL
jgi:hypothetical protein